MTWQVDVMSEAEALRCTPPDPDREAGIGALQTERGNLPLDSIGLRAAITGLAASLELTQGFRNPFGEPLEATFVFPLPDRAAVTALRMEADGRTVEAQIEERAAARERYQRAVDEGHRASIAEEERPGVFTMRVGNIMPAERVQIRLTLAAQLPYADGAVAFRFPLVVAPRYIPGTPLPGDQVGAGVELDTDAVPDASRISPPVLLPGFPNPVDLSIDVDVDLAGLRFGQVSSSLHVVTVDGPPDGRLRVRLAPGQRADRDFVLRLALEREAAISMSLAVLPDPGGEAGTFALTVLPPAAAAPALPRDLVLVLDRSGSMSGWKMVAARRAAARMVDTLTGADRFAVLAFDNVVEAPPGAPSGLVEATDRRRFRAVEYLAGLEARGGTEMLQPLLQAVRLLAAAAGDGPRDRALVLVTDGQVGNEDQILRRLAPALGGAQVYVVGVDTAVNEAFLRRLAHLGRGRCELVESEDRLDEVMVDVHRRIGAPVVTGLDLAPDGLRVAPDTVAPQPLPDLFAGAPLLLTGRYQGPAGGAISVRGDTAGGERWQASVAAEVSGNAALAAVWARARIRDLEDRYVTAPDRGLSVAERLEREIVDLSLRYAVLSRFTAFVAVDSRVVNEGGMVHRVTQPVDVPHGWDMFAAAAPHPGLLAYHASGLPVGDARPHTVRHARASLAADEASGPADWSAGADLAAVAVRGVAAAQLRRLLAAIAAPAAERVRLVAELAESLAREVARLRRDGADTTSLARLQRVADELAAACASGLDLGPRLADARVALAEIAGVPDPAGQAAARPVTFWRR